MAYDEQLTLRVREGLEDVQGITEKRMMGGVCFMLNGNMLAGADRNKQGQARFMFRVGKAQEADALKKPGAIAVEQGGRKMSGMVFVDAAACDEVFLRNWLAIALAFVDALPPK